MADGWEPANELEQRLLDAMQRGEQDRYFQVLNETALLLPVPMDANGQPAPGGWATWAYEGRTYLLAFTSQQAMVATLGQYAGEFRTAHLADISANWPDESWWLAIDFGLPIAGYLPAAFVSQITGGGAAQSGQPDQYPAQDQQEQYAPADPQAPYAPAEQQAPYAPAEQQAPQDQYQPAGEGQPPTAEAVSGDAAWAPPQQAGEPQPEPAAEDQSGAPTQPDPAAGTDGLQPANPTETSLLSAATAGDRKLFMDALLASYILIPVPAGAAQAAVTDAHFPWPSVSRAGVIEVPVFTSADRMHERVGESGYAVAPFVLVLENWPRRDWSLALNPDTQIGATLDGDRITELATWARETQLAERLGIRPSTAPAAGEAAPAAGPSDPVGEPDAGQPAAADEPAGEPELTPVDAASVEPEPATGPVAEPVAATVDEPEPAEPERGSEPERASEPERGSEPEQAAEPERASEPEQSTGPADDSGFAAVGQAAEPVEASTVTEADGSETVTEEADESEQPFAASAATGTDGQDARLDADSDGLDASDQESAGQESAGQESAGQESAGQESAGQESAGQDIAAPGGGVDAAAGDDGDEAPEWPPVPAPEPAEEPGPDAVPALAFPAPLQKTVPDAQVTFYLERHFDRVGGYVHRVSDAPQSADDLRRITAMGGQLGVPVHAIRWTAESEKLVPVIGATRSGTEPDLVEYRIASVRLPHGAELFQIGSDGTTMVIAVFNADQHRWHPLT